jgi:hypothetical protein
LLPASWSVPSSGDASVTFALSPSGLTSYPCATAGVFGMEIRAVDSTGLVTQWPSNKPIPFIVRAKL